MTGLDELQKAFRDKLKLRCYRCKDNDEWVVNQRDAIQAFDETLVDKVSVPVDLQKQAKTSPEIIRTYYDKTPDFQIGEEEKLAKKKWVSLDVVQQFLMAKERSLRKLLDEFPTSEFQTMGNLKPISTTWKGEVVQEWLGKVKQTFESYIEWLSKHPEIMDELERIWKRLETKP